MKYKVITISREYGSGGREIGRLVADRLGIDFYDWELVSRTAAESGMSEEKVKEFEESYSLLPFYDPMEPRETFSVEDRTYLTQCKVIRDMADKGPCVIVGRAAEHVLEGRDNVLTTFVYSDRERRINRVAAALNTTALEADRKISKMDRQRSHYYHHYTGNTWGDPPNYHVMLNSGLLGIEGAADAIVRITQNTG